MAFNMSTSFSISAAVAYLTTIEITNFKSNLLHFTLKYCMIPAFKSSSGDVAFFRWVAGSIV